MSWILSLLVLFVPVSQAQELEYSRYQGCHFATSAKGPGPGICFSERKNHRTPIKIALLHPEGVDECVEISNIEHDEHTKRARHMELRGINQATKKKVRFDLMQDDRVLTGS